VNLFCNKNILITGGTGSWGNELTTQLLNMHPNKIFIFSRGELAQVNMERKFQDKTLEFVIGDIRDREAIDNVMRKDIDMVYHMAALKHVPICENHPQETVKTNINGTINLINSAIKYKVKKFVDVSTDKAVSPINLYGYTKAIGEKITIQANNQTDDTDFVCVRGGNVIGSNGSVVPLFINQIQKNNKITITDTNMTRFFLTLSQAINLLFQATIDSTRGETFVMNMPSFYMTNIADVIISEYGNEYTEKVIIGKREGEKIHEVLISTAEAARSFIFNKNYFIIKPELKIDEKTISLYRKDLERVDFTEFSSNTNIKDKNLFESLLRESGF